jgi:membrane fusion protein, multidrug efflux system
MRKFLSLNGHGSLIHRQVSFFHIFPSIAIVGFITMAVLSSCGSSEASKPDDAVAAIAKPAIFSLQKEKSSASLTMPGEIIAFQQVDLYAKVNSFVKKLYVDVGSEVKQGQLLVTMEAPEINSQLSGAESKLKSLEAVYLGSKANYNRLLETSKTPGTVSPNDLDLAKAKSESDLATLEAAKSAYQEVADNKKYLEINAPFNGVITARNVSDGAYVGPSGKGSELPIFTLQEQKKLRLVVDVPEVYTGFLRNKGEILFSVNSLPGQVFKANIQRMAGALDSRLRSQRIEMDVTNNDKKLLPGMVAEITIRLPSQDSVFQVPESAIINAAEGIFIIRDSDGRAQWVPVKKGRTDQGKIEIYGNINAGDSIVLHASEEIRKGSVID